MFPSERDISNFVARFGDDGHLSRRAMLGFTEVAAMITPERTPEQTLLRAWRLLQSLAEWVVQHATDLPPTERYILIVAWSKTVRRMQGQVFKAGVTMENVQQIVVSPDWEAWERATGYRALLPNWQKEVFA